MTFEEGTQLPEQLALGLTALAMVGLYIAANLWLASFLANLIAHRTAPRGRPPRVDEDTGLLVEADEEIVSHEWVEVDTLGTKEMRSVSRGEMRARYWLFLFALPLLGFLNFRFFGQVVVGFDFSFELVGRLIARLFYGQ